MELPKRGRAEGRRGWWQRVFERAAVAFLAVAVTLVLVAAVVGSFGWYRSLALLSCVGLAIGCALAALHLRYLSRLPTIAHVGLAGVALSQVSFHLLVWSGWKTSSIPWRVWWITMVVSLLGSHLVLLRAARRTGRDPLNATAVWSAVAAAAGWAALALRRDLFGNIPALMLWIGSVPVLVTVVSSLAVAWRAADLARREWRVPTWWRRAMLVASYAAVLATGVYLGRSAGSSSSPPALPSALAHLSREQVEAQLVADIGRLRTVVAGLEELETEMAAWRDSTRQLRTAEGREYFLPGEDDTLRWSFVTFLSYRTALQRLVTTYSGFGAVRDPGLKATSFMLGYAAAMTAYRSAVDVVEAHGGHPLERRKLNESEPAWGLPAGMFDRVSASAGADRHVQLCEEMAAYFEHGADRWRQSAVWPEPDFRWLEEQIRLSLEAVRGRRVNRHQQWFDRFVHKVRHDAYSPVYAVQSVVAEWIGDIRIVERARFVDPATITAIRPRLRPGDILLERRSWHASNAFLPGFWPHAALYVGNLDDLRRLGVAQAPEIVSRLDSYLADTPDGHPYSVIEALAEGVIFTTAEHSLHADYVAVLRPRLGEDQIAAVVVEAFRHQGKPYDFEFDFFTADQLVCTELVYRSFGDLLHFDLQRVMGRDTLPALEFVRKYARERGTPAQELDLVLFLDGDPATGRAFEADEEAFVASADRMREFNE